jgi:putative phosphoribosyl transferase
VPVAFEIAEALRAPLDLMLVRKIGAPGQPELAIGAVADGNPPSVVLNEEIVRALRVPAATLARLRDAQLAEIERRRALYLGSRARLSASGRTAIVVDDGLATGATARVALRALRRANPEKLILAIPVAPRETIETFAKECDEIVCLEQPEMFSAVGAYYDDFEQVDDREVIALLNRQSAGGPPN